MIGVSIVTVTSVRSFKSNLSLRKFFNRTHFVKGHLLSRIDAFHLNQAVNPFSQLSASVIDGMLKLSDRSWAFVISSNDGI